MTSTVSAPRRRAALAAASTVVLALLLTGCAGSASDTSGAGGDSVGEVPIGAPAVDGGSQGGGDKGVDSGYGGSPESVVSDRSVVVRADMTVEVDDLVPATDQLGGIAARYGATIASQTTSAGTGYPVEPQYDQNGAPLCPESGCPTSYASSTTTLRVSNDDVDAMIADLAKLGVVAASYRTSEDVTAELADVDARLATAEASLARVRALMEKATTIADVVTLEAELSRRQADLEALQARQRTLADQTAQATVTVRLVSEGAPVVEEQETGFLAGLSAGWDAFTGAAVIALTVLGALVPFLLVLVPLALLVWWLVRRNARAHSDPRPTGPVDAPTA